MTGYDVKVAKLHAASLRRFVYDIIADQMKRAADSENAVVTAKAMDNYVEILQAVELVDGYLYLLGMKPEYRDKTEPEEDDD